jgi:hypothetical protein
MSRLHRDVAVWAVTGNTGISSLAIARRALGAPGQIVANERPPSDLGDLRRCLLLIEAAPGARIGLTRLAREHGGAWWGLNKHWRALTRRAKAEGMLGPRWWMPAPEAPAFPETQAVFDNCLRNSRREAACG